MKKHMEPFHRRTALSLCVARICALGALSSLAAVPAMAQQATADQAQPIQRVEITGSNIRRADAETPSPVQVITAEDLQKSGYTTVAQVLQNITANGQGTLSQGFSQAFAAGASGISLRGLTTSATLVLIDGHRMAPYPLSDDGQRSFVDISNIPFDAVERIEVLKDGASATYGSDAMAGVVNIILKKSFVGTRVSVEGGGATEGGAGTVHASVMHGFGDYATDGYNSYISLEYRHEDRVTYDQRAGDGLWQNLNWTSYGGINKTPGVLTPTNPQPSVYGGPYLTNPNVAFSGASNSSVFNSSSQCNSYAKLAAGGCAYQNPDAEISPETQNINLLGSFTKKLAGDWKLDLKASIFDSKAEQYPAGSLLTYPSSFSPEPGAGGFAASAGVSPHFISGVNAISQVTVPSTYPGNTLGTAAVVNGVIMGAPTPHTEIDSKASRIVADLSGTWGDWDIDSSLGWTKVGTNQTVYGSVNYTALNNALNAPNGSAAQWNLWGNNSQSLINQIFPTTSAYDTSTLEFAEFHASRSLMSLPGGDLGFSAGGSFIHRDIDSPAPLLISEGIVSGNDAYVEGQENDAALFMEIVAPITKTLELDGSLRFDHFNDVGNATTPKLGFKWTPTDVFALRGTIGTGFRAPNAAEAGNSGTAYLYNYMNDPVLCPGGVPASGNIAKGSAVAYCNYEPNYFNTSTSDLKPEKSLSQTLGFILEPIKGWSTTFDLYQVNIKDQIVEGSADYNNPVRGSPVSTLCADGNGGTYTCTTSVGPVLYYATQYINANSTKTSGFEVDSRYRFKLGEYGSLLTDLSWSHMMSYVINEDGTSYQLAGTHGPIEIGGDTGNPKDKVQLTFTWDRGPLEVATTFNWISSFDLTDPTQGLTTCDLGALIGGEFPSGGVPSQFCRVGSFLDTDLTVRYKWNKKLTLHGSVTNLFNQAPPVDLDTYGGGQLPYNPSDHLIGAIGRSVSVGAIYNF